MEATISASPDSGTVLEDFHEEHQRIWKFLQELETSLAEMEGVATATPAAALATLKKLKKLIPQLDDFRRRYLGEDEPGMDALHPALEESAFLILREGRESIGQFIEIFEAELERTHTAPCVGFNSLGRILWKRLWEHTLYEEKLLKRLEHGRAAEDETQIHCSAAMA